MRPPEKLHAPADVRGVLNDLDKYAGWLGRGLEPTRVREAVKLLPAAFDSGRDPRDAVDALESHIGKMPSSQVGSLLRKAVRNLRLAVANTIATDAIPYAGRELMPERGRGLHAGPDFDPS